MSDWQWILMCDVAALVFVVIPTAALMRSCARLLAKGEPLDP